MKRKDYLARAQQVLDEAHRRNVEEIHPCIKCEHYRKATFSEICVHPIVLIAQRNILDGDYNRMRVGEVTYQRGTYEGYGPIVCGPNGELFEPCEKRSLWQKFIIWLNS